jgi:hypothetical protein
LEIAKESTAGSAGVLGDQRPHDRLEIVERHEAMANHQFVERLMKSLGVFVAAPAGGDEYARHHERRGGDNPLVGGGIGDSGRAAKNHRAVDLHIAASDDGQRRETFIDDRDGGFGFGQSVLKDAGNPSKPIGLQGKNVVHVPFQRRQRRPQQNPLTPYARFFVGIKPLAKLRITPIRLIYNDFGLKRFTTNSADTATVVAESQAALTRFDPHIQ